ncbi:hypothetical protein SEPMUDRAFT_149732 [Lecanosticta acicola]|uniref:Uncharacterized protein n=1 Tax=Lecanosticta acicola TaxID=111012 RepID=A0AAI8Z653_9PEZI|nr:hypothetical protein SEPMUDRAFT_149732 [Lecanosticta acicola]
MTSLFRRPWSARKILNSSSRIRSTRFFADQPNPTPASPTTRVSKIESRLPKFLRRYVEPLRNAPISHITAFIILHELTAVVPLFALAGAFHYSEWLPPFISEGKWVQDGQQKFGSWMRKRGWIGDEDRKTRWWGRSETGVRVVVELATAYAITKALLPLRLILSVWGTPWFARWTVLPFTNRISRLFGRKKAVPASGPDAAGTGAVGGSAVPKVPE